MAPDNPYPHLLFAFTPGYGPDTEPSDIRIIFTDRHGYFETTLLAHDRAAADAFCHTANATAGLDAETSHAIIARSMQTSIPRTNPPVRILSAALPPTRTDIRTIPLPSNYVFTPSEHPSTDPQQLLLVFQRHPEIITTGVAAANLHDARVLCDLLNARLPPISGDFAINAPRPTTLH